jgi:hypothetical protein
MGRGHEGQTPSAARKEGQMKKDGLMGKQEHIQPIPGQNFIQQKEQSGQQLMEQAAAIARHPMGRGIPPDHEALQ